MPPPQTLGRGSLAGRPSQLPRAQSAQSAVRSPTDAAQEAFLQSLSSEEWRLIRGERPVGMEGWNAGIGGVGEDCWVGVVGADGFIYQPMLPIPCRGRCPVHRHDAYSGYSGRNS
ncbi:hypothetical protein GY45DRAFT_1319910 [Cubamyces sp. BRFM 1775]|nr:hypothetical protein GY45DRAFT_1319910 [Cubamyces sp. BRFM 1775]